MLKTMHGVLRYAAFVSVAVSSLCLADYEGLTISGKGWEHRAGALLQWDTYWVHDFFFDRPEGDSKGEEIWRSAIRRSRFELAGTFLPRWHYRLQWDLRNTAQTVDTAEQRIRDAWLQAGDRDSPLYFQLGQFREPLSIELTTPTAYVVPVERSLHDNIFYPRRSQGLAFGGHFTTRLIDHISYKAGVFSNSEYPRTDTGATPVYTGRATFSWEPVIRNRPWADPGDYFHIGLFASHRDNDNNVNFAERYTTNFQYFLGPDRDILYVDEDTIVEDYRIDNQQFIGIEAAVIYGRWYGHFEFLKAYHEASSSKEEREDYDPETFFWEVGWTITGEYRGYDPVNGIFDRLRPERSYGAWMVYFRWTDADLEDSPIGSSYDSRDLGVNWYINDQLTFKLSWRYIKTASNRFIVSCSVNQPDDDCEFDRTADLITIRVQADY